MSLATRCAACGTVFRVVQDQLKVSEGWVRCGRCNEVFNALEGLFDLDREPAPGWTPSQRGALDALPGPAHEAGVAQHDAAAPDDAADSDREPEDAAASPSDSDIDTHADSRLDSRLDAHPEARHSAGADDIDDDEGDALAAEQFTSRPAADGAEADASADGDVGPDNAAPAFLRRAERDARWRRPPVRAALALTAVLAGLLLAGQVALYHRHALAAHWPQAAPLLMSLCEPVGCRLEALRRLDNLSVESSGLTQLELPSLYRLQVALRSRDTLAVMTPALDVTLTDSRGEVVARKVLDGDDFGGASPMRLAPGGELTLVAVLDTGDRRVTGYNVEIFYP